MKRFFKKEYGLLLFLFLLIASIVFLKPMGDLDELWNYHFAKNITEGLIPYRDFNMITTPLLPMIGSLFLKIANELWMMRILASVLCTGVFFMIFKIAKQIFKEEHISLIITFLFIFLWKEDFRFDYNIATLLIALILLYQEIKEFLTKKDNFQNTKKQILLGVLSGCAFLTKQTIGGLLSATVVIYPILWISSKKEIKKYIKIAFIRGIGVLIPIVLLGIYLLKNYAIGDFVNYTILGIKTFNNHINYQTLWENENRIINFLATILPIVLVILITYHVFSKKEKQGNRILWIMTIYSIPMLVTFYPIANELHFLIGIIILIMTTIVALRMIGKKVYEKINWKSKKKWYYIISLTISLFLFLVLTCQILQNIAEYRKQEDRNDKIQHYNQIVIEPYLRERIEEIDKYRVEKEAQGKEVVILDAEAVVYELPKDKNYKDYSLFLKGNMGKDGEEGQIKKIKQENSNKLYLIRKQTIAPNWQTPLKVIQYIRNNLTKIEEVAIYEAYEK